MNNLEPINVGNFMYLDPNGTITLSLVFDAYIFDYLFMKEDKILDK
jgi:hypothetical protein